MNRQQTGFAVLDGRPKTPEQRRQAIEAELKALPELEAPRTIWQALEKRLDARDRPQRPVLKRALAAGAAAAVLSAAVLLSDRNSAPFDRNDAPAAHQVAGAMAPAVVPEVLVAELMERSRLAETRRRALPAVDDTRLAAAQGAWAQGMEAKRLLAARIASVDTSLNRLATLVPADPAAQERLWRERVELMDTLMRAEQVQREEFIRRAVY